MGPLLVLGEKQNSSQIGNISSNYSLVYPCIEYRMAHLFLIIRSFDYAVKRGMYILIIGTTITTAVINRSTRRTSRAVFRGNACIRVFDTREAPRYRSIRISFDRVHQGSLGSCQQPTSLTLLV